MYLIESMLVMFQAWNIESCANLSLDGPVGQIYAMVVDHDMLFAGAEVNFLMTPYIWCNFLCPALRNGNDLVYHLTPVND